MTTTAGRVRLRYTGHDTVSFAGSVHASPRIVNAGDVVEVDAWAAPVMLDGAFVPADEDQEAVGAPDELRGEALNKALRDAGLTTTGTADEKRARLADHHAHAAENGE